MNQLAISYPRKFRSAREALFALLEDCQWHHWDELQARAGVRYGARVCELRDDGYEILSTDLDTGKRYRLTSVVPGPKRRNRVKVFLDEADAVSVARGFPSSSAMSEVASAIQSFRSNKAKP